MFLPCTLRYPQVAVLTQARDALCAGDLDFVWSVDGAGVLAWTYPAGVEAQEKVPLASRNFPDVRTLYSTSSPTFHTTAVVVHRIMCNTNW